MKRPDAIEIGGNELGQEIDNVMTILKDRGFMESFKMTAETLPPPPNEGQWHKGIVRCLDAYLEHDDEACDAVVMFGVSLAMSVIVQQPEFDVKDFKFSDNPPDIRELLNMLFKNL